MLTSNGTKIRLEYTDGWEEKLAQALYKLHVRVEKSINQKGGSSIEAVHK